MTGRELHAAATRFEAAFQCAGDAMAIVDAAGNVVDYNARWQQLLGTTSPSLNSDAIVARVHPNNRATFEAMMAAMLDGKPASPISLRIEHDDGSWRCVAVNGTPLFNQEQRAEGAFFVFRDITDEVEAERIKNELISLASHEIRTPITTIKLLANQLLRAADRGTLDPDLLRNRVRAIQREAKHISDLSRNLSDLARARGDQLRLDLKVHDLSAIVATSVDRYRDQLDPSRGQALRFQRPAAPVFVNVDRQRLQQIVTNLLDNAVKYSPSGGDIVLRVERAADRAHLHIIDQGIGIPGHDLPKVYSPFFRASNVASTHFRGVGLGLYLSQILTEAHHGTLSLESAESQGTRVTLSLPLEGE